MSRKIANPKFLLYNLGNFDKQKSLSFKSMFFSRDGNILTILVFDSSREDLDEGCDVSSISRGSVRDSVEVANQTISGYFADNEYADVDSSFRPYFSIDSVKGNFITPENHILSSPIPTEKTPIASSQSTENIQVTNIVPLRQSNHSNRESGMIRIYRLISFYFRARRRRNSLG